MKQYRNILFDAEAMDKIQKGFNGLADAVRVTLGPKGRNVALDKSFGSPSVTKDGVSVARDIDFDDPFENIGAQVLKQAAIRTAEEAGDGTTTATVIAQELFNGGRKLLAGGYAPVSLKRGMDKAVAESLEYIRHLSTSVSDSEHIKWVATISSNGDTELGDLIADAMERVGKGGVISVEEGQTTTTRLEFSEGMQFDRGYIHPDFGNTEDGVCRHENPIIILVDDKVENPHEIIPCMEYAAQERRPLVIVAHDIIGPALATLVTNHVQGRLPALAIKVPRIGEKRTQLLQDLSALTDAQVISKETGVTFSAEVDTYAGGCGSVTADKYRTTFLDGHAPDSSIEERIRHLRGHLESAGSPHDQEFIQQRISQLGGGMAIIRVGAGSEIALKEYKARVEDALSATRSAVQSGIVAGGGCTLLHVSALLTQLGREDDLFTNDEERQGWLLVAHALRGPFRNILQNAGLNGDVYIERFYDYDNEDGMLVYNVHDAIFQSALDQGIVDPAKVVSQAITNAVSVASTLLTTSCAITFARS